MAFWINIHGCQPYLEIAIYVENQLKNDSYCQGLYLLVIRILGKNEVDQGFGYNNVFLFESTYLQTNN